MCDAVKLLAVLSNRSIRKKWLKIIGPSAENLEVYDLLAELPGLRWDLKYEISSKQHSAAGTHLIHRKLSHLMQPGILLT
jgi:hypothetical protein